MKALHDIIVDKELVKRYPGILLGYIINIYLTVNNDLFNDVNKQITLLQYDNLIVILATLNLVGILLISACIVTHLTKKYYK
jgi:hypothetical protein